MARITKKEKAELQKLNKNVSNKKSYVRNKYGVEIQDVQTVTIKQLEAMSRKDVNAYKNQMKSFTNRHNTEYQFVKNEEGEVFTKKEVNEAKRLINRVNKTKRERRNKVNRMNLKQGKESLGTLANQRGLMTKQKYQDLRELKFDINRFKSRGDFIRYLNQKQQTYEGDWQRKQDRRYKANYMRSIRNVFGIAESKELVRKIRDMSLDDFMDLYYSQLDMADIDYIYDPSEKNARLSNLKEYFMK